MRIALSLSPLCISLYSSAQTPIPQNALLALKSDNVIAFTDALNHDGLASCYSYKNSSYSSLAMSIKAGVTDTFKALLETRVDVEKACSNKFPLMYAAKHGQLEKAQLLIKASADLTYINNKGCSAKDYSKKYKQKEIYLYFKSLEASDKSASNTDKFLDW